MIIDERAGLREAFQERPTRSYVSGEIMIAKLLTRWTRPDDTAQDDDDGACPACDHPFGQLNHSCFGPLRTAS